MRMFNRRLCIALNTLQYLNNSKKGCESAVEIADALGEDLQFCSQILAVLRRSGFIQSVRGPGGGYKLLPDNLKLPFCDLWELFSPGFDQAGDNGDLAANRAIDMFASYATKLPIGVLFEERPFLEGYCGAV